MLSVSNLSASRLEKPNSYITVLFRGKKKRTALTEDERHARWTESLEFKLKGTPLDEKSSFQIHLKINDKIGKGRVIGSTTVRLLSVIGNQSKTVNFNNMALTDRKKRQSKITLSFQVSYEPPAKAKQETQGTVKQDNLAGRERERGSVSEDESPLPLTPDLAMAPDRETGRKVSKLSRILSDKPQDFQVRVRIVEGRQLQGADIRPVVKVYIGEAVFRTRVKRGNNPYFEEIFFQNFHGLPSEIFSEIIHIQVLNSHSLRADSILGIFKLDIGTVYDQPGHAVLRKWLLLYEPNEVNTLAKGYLKVSIIVLGAGDKVPIDKKGTEEEDDVESNLLQPAGIHSRWVTFIIKIYRAEDILHMEKKMMTNLKQFLGSETERKDSVDSFVEVSFAGNKIATKVIENQINPEWNQVINLKSRFPSLCENIHLTVRDRSKGSKYNALGTAKLSISKISSTGTGVEGEETMGFLPAFGPCFLNLYGSPRDSSDRGEKYDELNTGKGEGVSYCGRILMELITETDELPEKKLDNLPPGDCTAVQRFLHSRRFSVCVVFYSATQMQEVREPVQFEVSIGNYGNKYDTSCKLHASTTQYSRAMYDGNVYYYLPWNGIKPVTAVTSCWENITHRLETLNILLKITQRLKRNFEEVKLTSTSAENMAALRTKMIDGLIKDCSRPLPELQSLPHVTVLDHHLHQLRSAVIRRLRRAAKRLKEESDNVQGSLPQVEEWIEALTSIAEEPQNSLPDVIVWMLVGEKRVASARIKAHTVLYRSGSFASGQFCGRLQTVFLKYPMDKSPEKRSAAQLRLRVWMGLATDESQFEKFTEGKFFVAAERYENQAKVMGHWGTSGLFQHPAFSDAMGKIRLSKKDFHPLKGWQWDGKWTIDPERCLLFDPDAGHSEFMDEVFENESRLQEEWSRAAEQYTDIKGRKHLSKEEMEMPTGWKYQEQWKTDINRAVDENGWEYGIMVSPDKQPKSWNPSEKMYHNHRRRRWVRTRARTAEKSPTKKAPEEINVEGWEYAPLFGWKFHVKQQKTDAYRRRRWRRIMIPEQPIGVESIFKLEGSVCGKRNMEDSEEDDGEKKSTDVQEFYGMTAPFISCILEMSLLFQLRAYIYQARGLLPQDRSCSSDPYVQVSCLHRSRRTETLHGTVNPTWDQTLVLEELEVYGKLREVSANPPLVTLEVFNGNYVCKNEFLGSSLCVPSVRLDSAITDPPALLWRPLHRADKGCGEVLVTFELLHRDPNHDRNLPPLPPMKDTDTYMVPLGVRPMLQLTAIEILAWGVRNMKNYSLLKVSSPSLVVECSGEAIQTPPIKNIRKNPNFSKHIFFITVFLPTDSVYSPPIVIKVIDNRAFGLKPVVGQATIKSLGEFLCDPYSKAPTASSLPDVSQATEGSPCCSILKQAKVDNSNNNTSNSNNNSSRGTLDDDSIDWWCKFFASTGDQRDFSDYVQQGYDTIEVYPCALEDVPQFKGLEDFCHTFKLSRGRTPDDDDPVVVGEFKGSFKIYPLPEDPTSPLPPPQFHQLPASEPQVCTVRLYVVRALNLQPKDRNGLCDAYIKLSLGKVTVDDRDGYVPNTLNPVFGRMYQLSATIPLNKDLKISVYDYDLISQDENIGETVIDLENRFLSRFGARCGLPQTYCLQGSNQWRDQLTPLQLLDKFTSVKNYPSPLVHASGRKISIGDQSYLLEDYEKRKSPYVSVGLPEERLSLHLLRKHNMVPEHVETRTLFNKTQPGIDQGKLQLWIDLFPKALGQPGPPFDITPRKPKRCVLRCIIWNTSEVILEEKSVMGEKMSDIYIQGWMAGLTEDKQKTDVHYRSLDGEGNFNWRFIFPFDYLAVERVLVISSKEKIWSVDATEQKIPPTLVIQLWDNDKFSFDDYLGTLELNLNSFRSPTKWPENCTLDKFHGSQGSEKLQKLVSIFKQKHVRGWWPCVKDQDGNQQLAGKVEMSLEVVTENEAEERPAGKGRDDPNMNPRLEPPNRPDTSFLWFQSPLKVLRHIFWRKYKWWVIVGFVIFLPLLFIALFIYAFPNVLANLFLQSTRSQG